MTYSFVLIAYNEADNITQCIDSIMRLQGLGDSYEVLVVDDGSHDATRQLVLDYAARNSQVRLLGDGANHGRGYGRYTGVNAALGKYIIMVDADIIMPPDWLLQALPALQTYDVAGGIAVPDGDVAYVYRRFGLRPKKVMGSTTITGNNGIYKRSVFERITFDKSLRDGEDVDFNNRAAQLGVREYAVPGLTVEHHEHKSFGRSMAWLYQSGVGATRQLYRFGRMRLPDLAFFGTIASLTTAGIFQLVTGDSVWYVMPLLVVLAASVLHLKGKFETAPGRLRFAAAVITNVVLIICYYLGRLAGYVRLASGHSGGSA